VEWVVREGVGAGGEVTQALYAHMNNKRKKKEAMSLCPFFPTHFFHHFPELPSFIHSNLS
jgi:hypothetical protein